MRVCVYIYSLCVLPCTRFMGFQNKLSEAENTNEAETNAVHLQSSQPPFPHIRTFRSIQGIEIPHSFFILVLLVLYWHAFSR